MVKVIANELGYYGGELRQPGERFDIPDDVFKKRRPGWVRLAAFNGKGDHDGDGMTGGSKAGDSDSDALDLSGKTIPELRDIADEMGVDLSGLTRKADIIAAIEAGPSERKPFDEAPEPVSLAGAQKEQGGVEPDWIPPEHQAPKPVDD